MEGPLFLLGKMVSRVSGSHKRSTTDHKAATAPNSKSAACCGGGFRNKSTMATTSSAVPKYFSSTEPSFGRLVLLA
jgi:hypothetical protein